MLDFSDGIKEPEKLNYSESKEAEIMSTVAELEKVCTCVSVLYWDGETRYYALYWWITLRKGLLKIRKSGEHGKVEIKFALINKK